MPENAVKWQLFYYLYKCIKNECSEHKELTTFVVLGRISYKPPKNIFINMFLRENYISIYKL